MGHTAHLLTSAQVAERVGVNIATVNRWAKTGKLAAAIEVEGRKRGVSQRFFRVEDVDALRGAA